MKENKVTLDITTESGEEFCTLTFSKKEWDKILQAALSKFITEAIECYLVSPGPPAGEKV